MTTLDKALTILGAVAIISFWTLIILYAATLIFPITRTICRKIMRRLMPIPVSVIREMLKEAENERSKLLLAKEKAALSGDDTTSIDTEIAEKDCFIEILNSNLATAALYAAAHGDKPL